MIESFTGRNIWRILSKTQSFINGQTFLDGNYASDYTYTNAKPNQLSQIVSNSVQSNFVYNTRGSIKSVSEVGEGDVIKEAFNWDPEDRLRAVANQPNFNNQYAIHHYIYDYKGERLMKTSLLPTAIANNGQSIGGSTHQLLPYTVYVGGHYVVKHHNMEAEYSKHYYMGTQRIASKLTRSILGNEAPALPEPGPSPENFKTNGSSGPHINNIVLSDLSENLTRFNMPGVPTFNAGQLAAPGLPQAVPRMWYPCDEFTLEIDPQNLVPIEVGNIVVNYDPYTLAQLQCLCRSEETWAQMLDLGYLCSHFEELYFYHADYLGHTEYITDAGGYPYQFFYYSPFGESLVTQKAEDHGAYNSPYRFNAKELDEETGNYYYGARYYNPKWSLWLSVDPKAYAFPHATPYNFLLNNPIMMVDPGGDSAYSLTVTGHIVQIPGDNTGGTEFDVLYNDDCTQAYGGMIPSGILQNQKQLDRQAMENGVKVPVQITNIDFGQNADLAEEVYDFIVNSGQTLEWGVTRGDQQNSSQAYISTSHQPGAEYGGSLNILALWMAGYEDVSDMHSHPSSRYPYASGFGLPDLTQGGDRAWAESRTKEATQFNKPIPCMFMYDVKTKQKIEYNAGSKKL